MGRIMIGIDANPTPVGPQAAMVTGRLALVAAKRLALTIILIVAPGIMTLARADVLDDRRRGEVDTNRRINSTVN